MPNTLVWKVDWLDGSTLVTGSSDGQVAVWDIQSHLLGLNIASQSTLISSYPAHDCAIRKVSACPTSPNLFMTCGNDGRLFIHDIRQPWCPLRIHRIRAFMSGVSWCREKVVFADGDNMARVLVDGVEGHSENGFNKTQRSTAIARSVGYIWVRASLNRLSFNELFS